MALENEQELVDAVKNLSDQLNGLGIKAKKTGDELTAQQKAGMAAKDTLKQVTNGLGGFAAELGSGSTDLKTFNRVIDTASAAVGSVAAAFGPLGSAVGGFTKALAEGAKFVVGQLDATAKAFNEVSAVGATTARGMSALKEQQVLSGLSLAAFQKVVMANSETLARFKGMAGDGAEAFSDIIGRVSGVNAQSDQTLRLLGMNAEQIADTAGAFLTQQTRLGRSQAQTSADLARGTIQYAKELDLLSKATGMSREAIQKQQDAALSEARFRSVYQNMINSGNEAAAKQLMQFQTTVSSVSKDTGKGLRDLSSGITDTTEAQQLMVATNGAALDIQQRLTSGQISATQATEELQAALKSNQGTVIQQGMFNREATATFGDIPGQIDFVNAKFDENGKVIAKATATQNSQITATDQLTKDTIQAQLAIEGFARAIDDLTFKMMPKASDYTAQLATAMRKMVDQINKDLGRMDTTTQAQDEANWQKMTFGEKFQSGIARALEKSARLVGADTVANMAQQSRVESESSYLQQQGRPGVVAPGGGGAAAPGGGGDIKPTSQQDLSNMGLRIKAGDVQAEGAGISSRLIEMARAVQGNLPGFAYFSGFNDNFHQDRGNSAHNKGRAMDFVLQKRPTPQEGAQIVDYLKSLGATVAIDEYNNPSSGATAGHIHAQISARNGFSGLITGPTGGYQPNLTMHGTEQLTVTPATSTGGNPVGSSNDMTNSLISQQLSKLDELVMVMKNQVSASEKLIRMQS